MLLFGLDAFLREGAGEAGGGEIVVSQGRIENLTALFAKTWQRPPTAEELRGLVDDYVLEEALYREGLALGVDQDDAVIRRRVRQKMEFFVDDVVEIVGPTDAELQAWLNEHAQSYARPARFTFRQVYLNPDRRGDALQSDVQRMLAELRSADGTADPHELGDSSLLDYAYADLGSDRVASSFGATFAGQLAELPTGKWSGPVKSAFGLHLVFIDVKTAGRLPNLAQVREEVARDWSYVQREEASKGFYEEVLARYRIAIEWPQDRLALRDAEPSDVRKR
jgi:hypothetical protein